MKGIRLIWLNFVTVCSLLLSQSVSAQSILDVHGTSKQESACILKHFGKEIIAIEDTISADAKNMNPTLKEMELFQAHQIQKKALIDKIKRSGGYYFVEFDQIYYPNNPNSYITIEVVKPNDVERINYISVEKEPEPKHRGNDLIDKMIEFEQLQFELMLSNQIDLTDKSCPVYHCVTNFNHPKLKPYLQRFNQGAVEQKQLIINTLNKDSDSQRREAAAFLVGHFKTAKDILTYLLPHINDKSPGVRNNVIRVIGATLVKAPEPSMDVMPFIDLLNSPYDTDRNKALFILYMASNYPNAREIIYQKGRDKLIELLALKQPNNHDLAYLILKKISGQSYKDTNLTAWKRWSKRVQSVNKLSKAST